MSADLLERLGPIPTTVVHLDFETFYSADYTLRKLTTEAYVRDERFQVIGVGVRIGKSPTVWLEEWDFRAWAKRVDWSRVAVNCHHTQFDAFILNERYGIRPGFLFCTMSLGRLLHGEGALDRLGQKLGLGAKTDGLTATKGKRREEMTQAEWKVFGDYCRNDVNLGASLLRAMGPGFPRLELWIIDSTIRMFTEPVFRADLEALRKTLIEEREKKRALLQRIAEQNGIAVKVGEEPLEAVRAVLSSSDKFAQLLESMGESAPLKPNNKAEPIFAFAKTDPGMQSLLEHKREDVRFLAEARLAVKSTIIETRTERLIGIAQRGAVPFYLKYCGAHTHRWSGGDKMNPQNFNRGGSLRDAILAPPDHSLVVVDSSQVEARTVAWLAGEAGLVESFRRNDEKTRVYLVAYAEEVRRLGHEPTEEESAAISRRLAERGIEEGDFYSDEGSKFFRMKLTKKGTKRERQISKALILGLGFGMGWAKCATELLKGMLGTPPVQFGAADAVKFNVDVAAFERRSAGFDSGTCGAQVEAMIREGARVPYADLLIHSAVADHFVRAYRATNAQISRLWKACEEVIKVMETPGGDSREVRMTFRGLKVMRHAILKPNGMILRYPGLRRTANGFFYLGGKSGREQAHIYGGLLTENLVQSLARDIVAEQVMRVRADGYHLGTTTHDEGVAVVPDHQAEAALESALTHFRTPPAWCTDLPLNAEGGIGKRYGDAK